MIHELWRGASHVGGDHQVDLIPGQSHCNISSCEASTTPTGISTVRTDITTADGLRMAAEFIGTTAANGLVIFVRPDRPWVRISALRLILPGPSQVCKPFFPGL